MKWRYPTTSDSLRSAVAKDFRGGWNTFDTDLNLSSRFITECRNVYPDSNGRLRLRFGTTLFCDTTGDIDEIINMAYFVTSIIVFGANGQIVSVDGAGISTLIWDTAIAAALPGAPAGWSAGLTEVNVTQYNGQLVCCNGVDKPIVIPASLAVSYLQDAGTGSNANVPRALYCTTHNSYLVLAVTPSDTTTLFIGAKGTLGTFVGDPAPNDAINFSTATYVYRGLVDITGLSTFRDRLIVSFNETILSVKLGEYDDATTPAHVPSVADVIDNYGAVSQRCIVPVGDDLIFLDPIGISSISRAQVTGVLSPVRESALIANDVQLSMTDLTLTELGRFTFAVYDRLNEHLLFFVPKETSVSATTDNNVFVYCYDKARKFRAMAYFDNMTYRSGCRTAENRVFLSRGTEVFYYHNDLEPFYMDYATGSSVVLWDDDTPFDDNEGWSGAVGEDFAGVAIPYAWATPWSDMREPARIKASKHVMMLIEGAGNITLEMFTDRLHTAPTLSMSLTQSADPASSTQVNRPSNNEQLYAWPATFRRAKLRVSGDSKAELNFVAISLLYNPGGTRR